MLSAAIGFAILAYALALVQPFLPHVAFYVQRDALAELFCVNPQTSCNGSCYLMSKVRENGPESRPLTEPKPVRSLAPHLLEADPAPAVTTDPRPLAYPRLVIPLPDSPWRGLDLPPPRLSC
jgi:hypothetical protein